MAIQFVCPHCKVSTLVDDQLAGQSGPCRQCGQSVTVPSAVVGVRDTRRGSGGAAVVIVAMAGVLGLLGLLACGGFLLFGIRVSRMSTVANPATTTSNDPCSDNLRRIGVAMHNYQSAYGAFPLAYVADDEGKPMHSWRVLLLPFLDAQDVYNEYRFDEPWDGPNNRLLSLQVAGIFQCPDDAFAMSTQNTSYFVIQSPDGIFDGSNSCRLASVTDGLTNTLLVVEVTGANIQCLEPRDLDAAAMTFPVGAPGGRDISSQHMGDPHVLMADGAVRVLPMTMPREQVNAMISKAGGEAVFFP